MAENTSAQSTLKKEMLLELMSMNLEHARHVENERLSFNSIYIAVVAGFFALAFDFDSPLLTLFFIGILFIISLIGILFTKRWCDVFDGHMDKASEIALQLYGAEEHDASEPPLNKYYYFKHNYKYRTVLAKKKRLEEKQIFMTYEQVEKSIDFSSPRHRLCQIRTKYLFYIFYAIVVSVLVIFFIYALAQLLIGI